MTFVILLIFILEKRYEIQMNDTETKNTAVKAPALMSTRPVTAQDALDQCEKLSPMMVHYCQTKTGLTDPANTILFYRLGDFYVSALSADEKEELHRLLQKVYDDVNNCERKCKKC